MLTKIRAYYTAYSYNFPLLLAFLLPFGINYAIIIILWMVSFLAFDEVKKGMKLVFENKWTYVFVAFFLVHALGYFFSENKVDALNAIEIKLGFLVFPLLIFSKRYTDFQVKKIVIAFVSGCFLVCILCLFRASYLYVFFGINAFFYSEFTYFLHPSYFAMYLIFALLIVILFYKSWLSHLAHIKLKVGCIVGLFLITIFLCSSKMGLITAFLLIPTTLAIRLIQQGRVRLIIGFFLALVVAVFLAYNLFPRPFERIKVAFKVTSSAQAIDKTDAESTAVRILIWKESVQLIKQHVVFGITAGDTNDRLYKAYQDNGLTGAYQKRLNAHNQFLQTFIGTGIIGFILLLMLTVYALVYGFLKKNDVLVLFSTLMIFNFLVESMLQAQAGFIFFVFFLCFLFMYDFGKFKPDNQTPH